MKASRLPLETLRSSQHHEHDNSSRGPDKHHRRGLVLCAVHPRSIVEVSRPMATTTRPNLAREGSRSRAVNSDGLE